MINACAPNDRSSFSPYICVRQYRFSFGPEHVVTVDLYLS